MQRRAHDRIQTQLEAKFYCGSKMNFGVITNISKNGLFISTNIDFPVNINFDLLIPSNEEIISLAVKISRLARTNGECSGIGVEIIDPPQKYIDYVNELMANPNSSV